MMLVYQLKVGVLLVAFYLVFKWLLSRDTCHHFNRMALLMMVLLSLALPWVQLSVEQPSVVMRGVAEIEGLLVVGQEAATEPQPVGQTVAIVYLIYYIGVLAFLGREVWSLWQLRRLLHRGQLREERGGVRIYTTEGDVTPFSWFRNVVLSRADYEQGPHAILTHELAHVAYGHSLDVLLMNVLTVFQWWNPAAWLLKRELQQVHEFEADGAVLREGVDASQYQLLLIRKAVGERLFSMANNLNQRSLRQRIHMMNVRRSSPFVRVKLLAVVPVALLALVAFAQPKVQQAVQQVEEESRQTLIVHVKPLDVTDVMPEFPGGPVELAKYLSSHIIYPKDAEENGMQGRVIVTFVVNTDGSISDAAVVRSISPSLDEEAIRVIESMPKWKPGLQNGEKVRVKYTVPITFRLD